MILNINLFISTDIAFTNNNNNKDKDISNIY
jgi:hypothetical protein